MKNQNQTKLKKWGVLIISTLLLVTIFTPRFADSAKASYAIPPQINASVLTSLTNQVRTQHGLNTLRVNPFLVQAASRKVDDMFAKQYFAHISPQGLTGWYFMKTVGYSYVSAGENLANGFITNQVLFNAWMASPTHRANILNSRFQEIGIATKTGNFQGQTTALTVQFLGVPTRVITEPSTSRNILPTQTQTNYSLPQWNSPATPMIFSLNKSTTIIKKLIKQIKGQRTVFLKTLSEIFFERQTASVQ